MRALARDHALVRTPQRIHTVLASLVANITATALRRPSAEEVATLWRQVVGAQAARHSYPVGLRQGELLIMVDASAWLWSITLQRPHLLEQLRAAWGADAVTAIRVRMSDARRPQTPHQSQHPAHG